MLYKVTRRSGSLGRMEVTLHSSPTEQLKDIQKRPRSSVHGYNGLLENAVLSPGVSKNHI